ncbi:PrpF domain-containing protein [Streptomyces sp. NRRL S-87]|uniref:PrpF domain-containing protein n=1 Tax=Streptomyces sp. NRRL S-87 TaxID=1463920 RepID=UPI000560D8D7|nr:PrpF domain-containing protein [Streptomyces sp. NRRL S-87]
MNGYVAEVAGAPCPTLVLEVDGIADAEHVLRPLLTEVRRRLVRQGHADVLKIALVSASRHPLFDLDYRFVQCLPQAVDAFDFRGSCGHSILATVLVAGELRLVPRLAPGDRVRLRVLNNGDHIVCEVDGSRRLSGDFTLHFVQPQGTRLSRLLMTGRPVDVVSTPAGTYGVSLASLGNPYVFVDARDLGIGSQAELFGAGAAVFDEMQQIRRAAATLLGMPADSVFPKVAAIASYQSGRLAVRSISVPTWHPTLALTGTICLAAAASRPGTVAARFLDGRPGGTTRVEIDTAGGSTAALVDVEREPADALLQWVSVSRKQARLLSGPLDLDTVRPSAARAGAEPLPLTA